MGLMKYKSVILVSALAVLLNYLVVLHQTPSTPDFYKVLGVSQTANATEINAAFELLSKTELTKAQLFEVRHAHSVLSDARRRQVYDTFQLDVLHEAVHGANKDPSWFDDIQPDMEAHPSRYRHFLSETQPLDAYSFSVLVVRGDLVLDSDLALDNDKPWVILLYSETAVEPHELMTSSWSNVAGVASVGRVEIAGFPSLAAKPLRLPEVVVYNNGLTRYRGVKTVQAVTEWFASSVLKLPHVPYPASLKDFIHGSPHKVKVLVFGSSRAPLFVRQAAKKYQAHAVFAMVDWEQHRAALREYLKEPDLEFPEVVVLKDPGLQPVIYQGGLNSEEMERLMEEHKTFVLPQLRSISSEALGCGNSTSGDVKTWYCVIVAGRTGRQLNEMRGVLRRVLQNLTETENEALSFGRLSLSWLDGEKQKDFCYFYLHSPTMFEACGPRRHGEVEDIPKLFLIRFHRKPHEHREKARPRNAWASLLSEDDVENMPSQLVSIYNGSAETGEVVEWISQMVMEGDNQELPGFGGQMPELVPEEKVTLWTETKRIVADGQARAVQNSQWFGKFLSWASQLDVSMAPVIFFLAIFLSSHLFLHRKKMHQDAPSISEGHVD